METEAQHCPTDTTGPLGPAETLLPHYKFLSGLPRGSVVKHLPADAGDTVHGSSLSQKTPHASEQLSLRSRAQVQLPGPGTTAAEAIAP